MSVKRDLVSDTLPENNIQSDAPAPPGGHIRQHARNALALTISGALAKVLVFVASVFIIKKLSLADNGVLQLTYGFGFLYAVVSEVGVRGVVSRELARLRDDEQSARELFGHVLNARLLMGMAFVPLLVAALWLAGYDSRVIWYTIWFSLYAVLDSFALIMKAAMRTYNRMDVDAIASISARGLLTAIILLLVASDSVTLATAAAAHICSAALECAGLAIILSRMIPLRVLNAFSWQKMKGLLIQSAPLVVITILSLFYLQVGSILLSKLRGEEAVALLKTAAKFPEAAFFIPTAIVNALLPFLARRREDHQTVQRYTGFQLRYIAYAGIGPAAVIIFEPEWFILTLFKPEYLQERLTLQILGAWMPVMFMQHVLANMLICLNEERMLIRRYSINILVNLLLNVILIPRFGVAGAAVALILTECLGVASDTYILYRRKIRISWLVPGQILGLVMALGLAGLLLSDAGTRFRIGGLVAVGILYLMFIALRFDRPLIGQLLRR